MLPTPYHPFVRDIAHRVGRDGYGEALADLEDQLAHAPPHPEAMAWLAESRDTCEP